MTSSFRRLSLVAVVSTVATLSVGATTASAHGGHGYGLEVSTSALVTQAAKQLDVTRAMLVGAIRNAAVARIDAAVAGGDVDADEADELKDEVADNLRFAITVSRTKTVASNLGITRTALNSAFRAARKALVLARIDEAVADGDISAEQAAELKDELEDVDLPGYKTLGFAGFGCGYGHRGFGR